MQVLKRLFFLLTPYRGALLISALLLVVRAALELVPPLFQKTIIDEVLTSRDLRYIGVLIACLGDINAKLQDNLSGIRVIQAFARENLEEKRFASESENYYRARVKGIR